tara:strand:- start:67 stop:642 length:576 start_codon:yes stop_codon:yes gene_type:complete
MAPFGSCFFNQHSPNFRPEHPFLSPQNTNALHPSVFSHALQQSSGVLTKLFSPHVPTTAPAYSACKSYGKPHLPPILSLSSTVARVFAAFSASFASPNLSSSRFLSSVTTFSPPRVVPKKIIATAKKNAAFIAKSNFLLVVARFRRGFSRRVVDHHHPGKGRMSFQALGVQKFWLQFSSSSSSSSFEFENA